MNLCCSKNNVGAGYNTLKILVAKYQQFKKKIVLIFNYFNYGIMNYGLAFWGHNIRLVYDQTILFYLLIPLISLVPWWMGVGRSLGVWRCWYLWNTFGMTDSLGFYQWGDLGAYNYNGVTWELVINSFSHFYNHFFHHGRKQPLANNGDSFTGGW